MKKFEKVQCVFKDCDYSTNIYSTFASHKSRKHNPHSLEDFKDTVLHTHTLPVQDIEDSIWPVEESEVTFDEGILNEGEDLVEVILKLECIFNVPSRCVDEIVEELQFIVGSASASVIKNIVCEPLENHGCTVEELLITDAHLSVKSCQCSL